MRPEVRDLIAWATANGWTDTGLRKGGHHVLTHPSGGRVTVAATPSDTRSLANTWAHLRRATGFGPERQRAGRYRHPRRRNGFDMDAALRERDERRHSEAQARTFHTRYLVCASRLREIYDQPARKDMAEAQDLIAECLGIERRCRELGFPIQHTIREMSK